MSDRKLSLPNSALIPLVAVVIPLLGLLGILIFTGFAWTFGVGLVTATAAAAVGLLFGLLFGVPRAVSSGQLRQNEQSKAVQAANLRATLKPELLVDPPTGGALGDTETSVKNQNYETSTNLAEVSDWLTKLLLGAGLVSLTKLGAPLGRLIDSVARGLSSGSSVSGSAKVVSGAIIFGYVAMGFLVGYILTTLWYQKKLNDT